MRFNKKTLPILISLFLVLFAGRTLASVEVLGSLKHNFTANPGETVKGEIRILNNESTDQEVRIYQTDLLYNLKDQTFYDEPTQHSRSNAQWLQYSPKTVVLKPKEARNIEYEIKIPAVDTLKGTYWSVLMVEGVTPIDPNQSGDLNIRTVTRYAVQIITDMNNKGVGSLKFLEPTLVRTDDKKLYLAIDMVNTGDHYISPELTMELYDEKGELVKTITATKKGLYPTTSTRFRLDLEGLASKKTYTAMIVAAGPDNDVFGLEYTLYF